MYRSFTAAIVRFVAVVQISIFAGVAHAETKVACVGDSITALPTSWCGDLSDKLGAGYTVSNFGVSGTNLLKDVGQPYWSSTEFAPSHDFAPNIVVIMLGTNDAIPANWAGKDHFVADYEALIDSYTSLDTHPTVYLIIPTPIGESPFGHSGDILANEVVPMVKQVAMNKGVTTIDAFTAFGGTNFDPNLYGGLDQVHPSDQGQQIICDLVYAALMSSGGPGDAGTGGSPGSGGSASPGSGGMAGGSVGTGGSAGGSVGAGGAGGGAGTMNASGAGGGSANTGSSANTGGSASLVGAGGSANTSNMVNAMAVAGTSAPAVPAPASSGGGCRMAGNSTNKTGPTAMLLVLFAIAIRRRKRNDRLPSNVTRCISAIAVLILWACWSDDASNDVPTTGMSSVVGGTGTGGAMPGATGAGAGGSTPGAAAGTSGTGGTSGGGGMTAGASGATSGTGGAAGMKPPIMTPATGGMGGGTAGGGAGGTGGTGATSSSRPLSSTLKLPTMMESPGVAPFFHVWRPTDLAAVDGKLPVFVWNNGACSRNDGVFQTLFEKWASGGYFVLSLTDGGGSSSTTQEDQKALIDWVVAQAEMAGGPYNGKLDLDRIVAGGNSCGGITSLGLASMDQRVAAVFVLSGSSGFGGADTTVITGIKVPVAYLVGGEEDISRANAEADYEAFASGLPAMIVKRSSGDHLTISNDAMVMTDAADMSINWLDLTMFGLQGALDALKTPSVCSGCQSGLWTMTSKNLETLVK